MGIKNIADFYPLSPMQQGMLFHSLAAPNSGVYFEQFGCTFKGDLNLAAFNHAWQQVVDRHPILRTSFAWEGLKEPVQIVHKQVEISCSEKDWRYLSTEEQERELEGFLERDLTSDFELTRPSLMRLTLIRLADNYYHFVWSQHHILLDGWSTPLVFQEVFAFYQAFLQDEKLILPTPRPYRDYIVWLQQQNVDRAKTFWRETLQGFTIPTQLGQSDRQRQNLDDNYDRQAILLNSSITKTLESFSQKHQLTLNTLIQGAWALLLGRYSNEQDVVFGATISGRPSDLAQAESMVGLFINTLPIRVKIDPEASILPWLQQIQAQQVDARQYEYSSLIEIQGWSEVPRNIPLFETIVVFENYPAQEIPLSEADLDLEIKFSNSFDRTNYPLTLSVTPGKQLLLEIAYESGDRFNSDNINRMLGHLITLLESIAVNPQQPLSQLSLLTTAERQQILFDWNNTQVEYPVDKCIHALFEEQVAKTPDALAVVFGEQSLTYRQLNEGANQLAHYLQTLGVKPETLVGICVERSVVMVIGLLGILKAGGAYLPLNPTHPVERLAEMLADAEVSILLTQQSLVKSFDKYQADIVCLDSDWQLIAGQSQQNPISEVTANNLAYVIYTSGSTGKPKGVMVEHSSLVNNYFAWSDIYQLSSLTTHLQMANFAFDVFTGDLVRALCSGGKLVLCPHDFLLEAEPLYSLIQQQQVDCGEFVPVVLRNLVEYLQKTSQLLDMSLVICGSDSWYGQEYEQFQQVLGNQTRLINSFGVTEATIDSCYFEQETSPLSPEQLVPIGKPFANTQLYILDSHLQPVPIGVAGELYIGGRGLARGYLNCLELTREKFIANPFLAIEANHDSSLLYKTGDKARYLADGKIEFLGRFDYQVKIRGFRVELGEIEATIARYPITKECVVISGEDSLGDKQLVAYFVATQQLEVKQLREFLKFKLPDYMIPTAWVQLDALPLTPNGKIDRKALPIPDFALTISNYVAPRNPQEEILANIWQEVLNIDQVGINDNFFELGGHSLLATRLISRVKQVFKIELPLRSLFDNPTITSLARSIQTSLNSSWQPEIKPVSRIKELPLSFAQQRLWFLAQLEPNSPDYNLPSAFTLKGKLDVIALEQSFNQIIERHEVLRTSFIEVDGKVRQLIAPTFKIDLSVIESPELLDKKQIQSVIKQSALKPFNLSEIPLLRIKLLRLNPEEHILIVVMHHIISDFWSEEVLLQEFTTLYEGQIAKKSIALPELPIQYADFSVWQRQSLKDEILASHLDYWQQQLQGKLPVLEFSSQSNKVTPPSDRGATYDFTLDKELSDKIQALSKVENTTLFIILLTTFKVLLSIDTQQQDILIGSPIANRDRLELESLIGFFVNTLLLRTNLSGNPTFRELLGRVREVTLNGYAHQSLPFEKLIEVLQPDRQQKALPFLQVWFTLTNMREKEFKLSNLTIDEIEFDTEIERYQLRLDLTESLAGLEGSFGYKTDLFESETIALMAKSLETILRLVVNNPNINLTELIIIIAQIKQEHKITQEKELAQTSLGKLKKIKRKIVQ